MGKNNIIYGRIPVLTCLQAGRRTVHKIYLQQGITLSELKKWEKSVPIEEKPKGYLDRITKNAIHQGIVAEVDELPLLNLDTFLQNYSEQTQRIVLLDHIEDTRNFGAIIRSAVAFNIKTIIIPHEGSAPITPVVIKTSSGAVEYSQIVQVKSTLLCIRKLKELHFGIYALDANGNKKLNEVKWEERSVLVIGSEGKGIRPLIKRECDYIVSIPTVPPIEQLNASVSAGIAFYAMATS